MMAGSVYRTDSDLALQRYTSEWLFGQPISVTLELLLQILN